MTPANQILAIAIAVGWREAFPADGKPHPETLRAGILLPYKWVNEITQERAMKLPDYLNDLNAMYEAEKTFVGNVEQESKYATELFRLLNEVFTSELTVPMGLIHATPKMKSEAFLKAIGGWYD